MVVSANGDVTITNDGATILQRMHVTQPAARMFVELSKSQDVVAGDGTTSVTVLAGSILGKCHALVSRGVHPTAISDALGRCVGKAVEVLRGMAVPVDLGDRDTLVKAASTSLNSKVVSQYAQLLAPMAVDCVLAIRDEAHPESVDLRDVRVVKRLGGTVDDSELVPGVVFDHKASKSAGGPTRVEGAKIGLIQFCVSPPKTDIENSVVVSDYAQMDRILRDERNYILGMVKKIKASGCNVLLIQKSILRDAVNDLALHYLAKAKILVVRDIERDEIEYLAKSLGLAPMAHVDHMRPEKLGEADLVEEVPLGAGRVVRVTGIKKAGATACVLLRGSNALMLEEADRSLHDALCVVRCLVHNRALLPGGGAPEIEVSRQLGAWAKTLSNGTDALCARAFADALEVVPYTLAENAGLNAISVVTELRNLHAAGHTHHGINVRKGCTTDMVEENVVQPLLVTTSALTLATECVRMILRIDDIVPVR